MVKEERLRREKVLRDWLREWPFDGLPAVPAVKKPKRDPTAHHCAEQVTAEVRRGLGRASKAKIKKTKDSQKDRQDKRDQAEKMRISHEEQESLGSKWKPGSRNTSHEDRPGKERERKAKQETEKAKQEKKKKAEKERKKAEKERKAKQEGERKKELKTVQESKDWEELTVSSVKSPVVSQAEAKQLFSEETNPGGEKYVSSDEENVNTGTDQPTFSELTNLTFSPNNHHQLEAEVNFKQAWRDQPDLTDDSGDEKDLKHIIKKVSSGGGQKCDRDVANLTDSSDEDDVSSEDEEEVSSGGGQECNGEMPDLTDGSDGEEVKNGTDQQD